MLKLICCLAAFFVQGLTYLSMGVLLTKSLKSEKNRALLAVVMGFFATHVVFEAVALPMIISLRPLSNLTVVWGVFSVAVILLSILCDVKFWTQSITRAREAIASATGGEKAVFILLAAVLLFQVVHMAFYREGSPDSAYYIGTVSTAVYTDTMGRFNPYTGAPYTEMKIRYIFSAYPMFQAVMCQMFKIPALMQTWLVMSETVVLFSNAIFYLIGRQLFPKSRVKACLVVLGAFLVEFGATTIFTTGQFLMHRTYEGKAVLAAVILPMLVYCLLRILDNPSGRNWLFFWLVSTSGFVISMSALFIIPVAVSALLIPYILFNRRWKAIIPYALCLMPYVIVGAAYLAGIKGVYSILA